MIVFGTIPSRRLGKSLGINNVPFKTCSYSCVYCQVGLTNKLSVKRKKFFETDRILNEVREKIVELKKQNEKIDYITFVPDGEPTLDINLGNTIRKLKTLGYKIAVITNSSLIFDKSVQDDLIEADLVSLKIDTVDTKLWQKINRPHGSINFDEVKKGMLGFASGFEGTLYTETMLVKNYNNYFAELYKTGRFIKTINPKRAYITLPIRPPAENIFAPEREMLKSIKQVSKEIYDKFEVIDYNEGNDFTFLNNLEKELLSIISVHPMSKNSIKSFIKRANANWNAIDNLLRNNIIKEIKYNGNIFYKIN